MTKTVRAALAARRDSSLHDLLEDEHPVLAAGILVSDHAEVGQPCGHRAHRGSLLQVALPRRPENRPEPSRGRAAQLVEHGLERVGGVRVVNHHREGLTEIDAAPSDR